MSYQLIYTSAPALLEPGLTGYGTVARSHNIPMGLARQLVKLSIFKETAGTEGAQYSYRTLHCQSKIYHVLSCVQLAGADYTGRNCHIAHHLALTKDEVEALKISKSRPTPAGLILALHADDFWKPCWQGEPELLELEPRLSSSMLPDASEQPTWKRLTGHKANAKAFQTPPYEHDCLVLHEEGLESVDILLLTHESDWISSKKGWNKTFTTHGDKQDSFAETQRIVAAEGSPLEARARRTGRPILRIKAQLHIPSGIPQSFTKVAPSKMVAAAPAAALPETRITPAAEASNTSGSARASRFASRGTLPYGYLEDSDDETLFLRKSSTYRMSFALIFLILSTIPITALLYKNYKPQIKEALAPQANKEPVAKKVQTHIFTMGEPLPQPLARLLAQCPQTIEGSSLEMSTLLGDHFRVPHSKKESSRLSISQLAEGKFLFMPLPRHPKSRFKQLIFNMSGETGLFTYHDIVANVDLRLSPANAPEQRIISTPAYKFPLTPHALHTPSQLGILIQLNEADIILDKDEATDSVYTLRPSQAFQETAPWKPFATSIIVDQKYAINLPIFEGFSTSEMVHTPYNEESTSAQYNVQWESTPLPYSNKRNQSFSVELTRSYDFSGYLQARFDLHANQPALGGLNLANLYAALVALETNKRDERAIDKVCMIYLQEPFKRIIDTALEQIPQFIKVNYRGQALTLSELLKSPIVRNLIRQQIVHHLNHKLQLDYYQSFMSHLQNSPLPPLQLQLRRITTEGTRLLWHFELTQAPQS